MREGPEARLSEYLIEVPHSPEECPTAEQTSGEPPVGRRRTYFGCGGGTHTTWILAELATDNDAWSLVPPLLRDTARVTRIDRLPSDDASGESKGGSL